MTKVILRDPETKLETELDNPYVYAYTRNVRIPCETGNPYMVSRPSGQPIIMITSNMPDELREEVNKIILHYCEL